MNKAQNIKKTFNLPNQAVEKLLKLRSYHNKTYDGLISLMIENAYLSMEEAVNLNKGKELEEQNLKVGFQVQQLTLMFSELKKELAEVKKENTNLVKSIDEIKEDKKEISKALNEEILKNKGRSEKYSSQIKNLEKYNQEKDKSWLERIKG